jgi:hypothetical protein
MLVLMSWSVDAGESRVLTLNENFRSYGFQPREGDMDLEDIIDARAWNNGGQNISTAVLVEDMDGNGVNELVFGTDGGRLVAVELGTWYEIIDERVLKGEIQSLEIGNLDDDEDLEVALTSVEGVHCYDTSKDKVTWSRDYETFDSDVLLVPARTGPDELDRSDVLVLRSKGTPLLGTEHYVIRLDGEGKELYKTKLQEKEDRPALRAGWVVTDLDRDNDLDIFVSDRGKAGFGASGPGKNIWLVEASNGSISDRWVIRHATLASRPMLVISEGWKYVAVGMDQGLGTADSNDLVLFDPMERSFQYLDVYANGDIVSWQYLTYVPDATSGTVVMTSSNWNMHAFHMVNRNATWSKSFEGAGISTNPVACDVDNDGRIEVLAPGGGITFIDVESGQVEGRYQLERGAPINIALTVGDVDDDDVSEVVFGYHDADARRVYDLMVLGQVELPEPEEPVSSFWGWLLIVFVVVANVLLVFDLFYSRKRRSSEEDDDRI